MEKKITFFYFLLFTKEHGRGAQAWFPNKLKIVFKLPILSKIKHKGCVMGIEWKQLFPLSFS